MLGLLSRTAMAQEAESAMGPESQQIITEIRFVGNEVTSPRILRQEMLIKEGDVVDPGKIEASRQAIMDLGLFKEVEATLLPEADGQALKITVTEKLYILPIPKLDRNADGEVSYGAQIRWDNIAGLNQRLRATYEIQKGCCANQKSPTELTLEYQYPRWAGLDYGLNLNLTYLRAPASKSENGVKIAESWAALDSFGIGLNHWLGSGPSTGWLAGVSWSWSINHYDFISGDPTVFVDSKSEAIGLSVSYLRVHDYLYSRSGMDYGYQFSVGPTWLGSDKTFSSNQIYYRHYFPIGDIKHQNIDLQMRFGGAGGSLPGGGDPYSLGGSRDLRAYEKGVFTGKSFFSANVEYLRPMFGYAPLRSVLFYDVGNTYPDNRVFDVQNLESALGVGLRYRVKWFVDLQIRADYAKALGQASHKFYVGTRSTF
ncbi:MAG: BamA/TamA family outer membrane protein [Gammaproteobacteria bacterium]|nr:BamA/TamA family outer membrane protein [Gammaproteobacteria bacterium]